MNSYNLENFERPKLTMPNNGKKLLMHSCCAPCAGEIWRLLQHLALIQQYISTTLIFMNIRVVEIYCCINARCCNSLQISPAHGAQQLCISSFLPLFGIVNLGLSKFSKL